MTATTQPTIFLSYSRRQLYFAESVALHLQKKGLDVWFDLQQLQAGTVWSDGLKDGIHGAGILVLVVSRASLASSYVEDEWRGAINKGNKLVLAIYESVELPKELRDLPTFDFRNGFNKKLRQLAGHLKGEAGRGSDKVASPNRLRPSTKIPGIIWVILAAQLSAAIALILVFVFLISFNPANQVFENIGIRFLVLVSILLSVGIWNAFRFLRHKLAYKKVKRSILFSFLLLVTSFLILVLSSNFVNSIKYPVDHRNLVYLVIPVLLFNLFFYFLVFRRSASLLRWMQPEEDLQSLRRRVHLPLIPKQTIEKDVEPGSAGKTFTYTIHSDGADRPLATWMTRIFGKLGYKTVMPDDDPQHHVAILSNRSSEAWVQELTASYAGKLVFVVVSTIEFSENLKETGRYQWVDARNMDRKDIIGLAKGLGDAAAWKREAALESTPDKIDSWRVPAGITVLKRVFEVIGSYVFVLGLMGILMELMDHIKVDNTKNISAIVYFVQALIGVTFFWLISRGLVYRKIPGSIVYGFALVIVVLMGFLGDTLVPGVNECTKWYLPVFIIPLLIYSAIDGRFWLPAFNKLNHDEVGIKRSIGQKFRRKRLFVMAAWLILLIGGVIWMYAQGKSARKPSQPPAKLVSSILVSVPKLSG